MIVQKPDGTVEFAYYRPGARDVRLAGDFTGWRAGSPMRCDERGWWRAELTLEPGKHLFKYVVDGSIWETDYAAYGVENDRHGGWNSVVQIEGEAKKLQLPKAA